MPPVALTESGAAPVTFTETVALLNPGADAVMFTVANPSAVTCGCVVGVVAPPAMKTIPVLTLTFVGSALNSVTLMPPPGAGVPN